MSDTPNLFTFATSELSQDAVLAYLFAWADEKYKAEHEKLYELGRALIAEMAVAAKVERDSTAVATTEQLATLTELPAYDRVLVKRQLDKIDIVVFLDPEFETLGNEHSKVKSAKAALLIEDKVFTSEHSGQLKKYLSGFDYGVAKDSVYPVFYKTGLQAGYASERAAGFAQYSRNKMLELLSTHQEATKGDTILSQYHSYLQGLTNKYAAGREFVPTGGAKNNGFAWQGFMHELAKKVSVFGELNWEYVHNHQGGFFGMWWRGGTKVSESNFSDVVVYLQLHESLLTIRAGRKNGEKIPSIMRRGVQELMKAKLIESLSLLGYALKSSGREAISCRLFKVLPEGANTTFATGTPIDNVAQKLITITKAFDVAMRQRQADNR